jgi:hypothetical protein
MAQEEEGEVPEVSRRPYLRGAAGVVASNLSTGTEALAQRSKVKRCAIMTVDTSGTAASPAVSSDQLRSRHTSVASASSHGTLTAQLTRAVGGPSSFWGPPALRPPRGCVHRPGSRGLLSMFWIPGIPVHLLLGLFNGPASAQGSNDDRSYWRRPSSGGAS